MNKRKLEQEDNAFWRYIIALARRGVIMVPPKRRGRPPQPIANLLIYRLVSKARKLRRPKHPGLKPVRLSWDKAYKEVSEKLLPYWGINLSEGAIRAAYDQGKKVHDQAFRSKNKAR